MEAFVEIIKTVGVPIAFCIALAAYVLKRDKRDAEKDEQHVGVLKEMRQAHVAELQAVEAANGEKLDVLTQALNNNTIALTELSAYIAKGGPQV